MMWTNSNAIKKNTENTQVNMKSMRMLNDINTHTHAFHLPQDMETG